MSKNSRKRYIDRIAKEKRKQRVRAFRRDWFGSVVDVLGESARLVSTDYDFFIEDPACMDEERLRAALKGTP